MTAANSDSPVIVSRAQVRAAKELIRLRGEQVHPVVQQVAELEYQQQVFKALQRQQPPAAVLRRQVAVPGNLRADFVLDDGVQLLVIEVKSAHTPLGTFVVHQARHYLDRVRDSAQRPVGIIVVSRSGFTPDAVQAAAEGSSIHLVTWTDRDDDPGLEAAVHTLSTPHAAR